MTFKLTYATMHHPPQELHDNFDKALADLKSNPGREFPMYINGEDRYSETKQKSFSPINTSWHLATFQKGTVKMLMTLSPPPKPPSPPGKPCPGSRGLSW